MSTAVSDSAPQALPDGQQVSRRLEFLELPSRDAYTRHIEASPSDDIPSDLGLLPRAQSALEESRADELLRFGAAVMSTSVGLGPFGRSGRRSCSGTAAAETVEAVRLVLDKVRTMWPRHGRGAAPLFMNVTHFPGERRAAARHDSTPKSATVEASDGLVAA